MKSQLISKVFVKRSPIHGYGVYAAHPISANDVIEECYCLLIRKDHAADVHNYVFEGEQFDYLALGFGSLYNHAKAPNATYQYHSNLALLTISACKDIKKGEEIFVSYGKEWFSSRKLKVKSEWHLMLQKYFILFWRFILILIFIYCFTKVMN